MTKHGFSISRDKEKQALDSCYMGEQHLGGAHLHQGRRLLFLDRSGAQMTFQLPMVTAYKLSQSVHKEQERFFHFSPSNAPLCVAIGDPLIQHHNVVVDSWFHSRD